MATEFVGVRIDSNTLKLLKKQANKERRTLSGVINKLLADSVDKK